VRGLQLSAHVLGAGVCAVVLVFWPDGAEGLTRFWLPRDLLLTGVACFVCLPRLWRTASLDRVDATVLCALLLTEGSLVWAASPWVGARFAVGCVALGVLVMAARPRAGEQQHLWSWLEAAVALLAFSSLVEAAGWMAWSAPGFRPGGVMGQRNHLAHALVLGVTTLLVLRPRPRQTLVVFLVAWAVTLTRSRAAWVASVPVLGWLTWRTFVPGAFPKVLARGVLLAAAVGVGLALVVPNTLQWQQAHPYRHSVGTLLDTAHGSGAGRVTQARTGLALFLEHPLLGAGTGQWRVEYPRAETDVDVQQHMLAQQGAPRLAHSALMARLVDWGLLGLGVLLVLAWQLWRRARAQTLVLLACVATLDVLDVGTALAATGMLAAVAVGRLAGERSTGWSHRHATQAMVAALALVLVAGWGLQWREVLAHAAARDAPLAGCDVDPTQDHMCGTAMLQALVRGECEHALHALHALEEHHPHHPLLVQGRRETAARCH